MRWPASPGPADPMVVSWGPWDRGIDLTTHVISPAASALAGSPFCTVLAPAASAA